MKLLIDYAMTFVGIPYKWGGSNPMTGLDCSGLVQCILESVGADPRGDQSSQALHDILLQQGGILLSEPKAGAIAFYGQTPSKITHVTFCLNKYIMIEAGGGDSTTTSVVEAAKKDAYVRVRPIDRRKDLVAVVMPNYPLWVTND